jgi:predicted translin family RNA/ssDNA-binding protein
MATGPSPVDPSIEQTRLRREAEERTRKEVAELSAARKEMDQAQKALDRVSVAALKEFDSSADYTAAKSELAEAQKTYNAASAAVISTLSNSSDYIKALAEQNRQRELVKAAKEAGDGCCGADVAADAVRAGGVVHAMEAAALTTSPEVKAARARLKEAQAKVSSLRSTFFKSLPDSGPTGDAKAALAAAHDRVIAAEAVLAGKAAPPATKLADASVPRTVQSLATK